MAILLFYKTQTRKIHYILSKQNKNTFQYFCLTFSFSMLIEFLIFNGGKKKVKIYILVINVKDIVTGEI